MEIKKRITQDKNGRKYLVTSKNKWRSITPTQYETAKEHQQKQRKQNLLKIQELNNQKFQEQL